MNLATQKTEIKDNGPTQIEVILELLKAGKTLTSDEAYNDFNCRRLSSRIQELRDMGYVVITEFIQDKKIRKRYARYSLAMSPNTK